jgi:pumilio RNA-binding family
MYSQIRSSPSPHTQAYGAALDYSAQMPVMLPGGAMYGPSVNHQAMHLYQQGMRVGRTDNEPTATLRSQLLEDFRANKARKWELRVSYGTEFCFFI